MKALPLSDPEIKSMCRELANPRNAALFIVGLRTGFRISELLSLRVCDVVQRGAMRDRITVARSNMKRKLESRSVVLHPEAKQALIDMGVLSMPLDLSLFPISRVQAYRIIRDAAERAYIPGTVSTHSMRKSFAERMRLALNGDLVAIQRALGHKSISSTVSYLSYNQEEIDKAIRGE